MLRVTCTAIVVCLSVLGCAGASGPNTSAVATLGDDSGSDESATTTTPPAEGSTGDSATSMGSETLDGTTEADTGPDPDDSGSSTSGELSCDDDPAACTAWFLGPGADSWVAMALDPDSPLAPTDTVRASFDVESEGLGFVLTDTRLHVVDLLTRQWLREDNRATVLPDLEGADILVAYTVPSYWTSMGGRPAPAEGVTFLSATTVYIYGYDIEGEELTFDSSLPLPPDNWGPPNGPDLSQVRASWLDVSNADDWPPSTVAEPCGLDSPTGPYQAVLATDTMHLVDSGYCFEFFNPIELTSFEPFTLPGAPQGPDIGASLFNETMGLWVFRGE